MINWTFTLAMPVMNAAFTMLVVDAGSGASSLYQMRSTSVTSSTIIPILSVPIVVMMMRLILSVSCTGRSNQANRIISFVDISTYKRYNNFGIIVYK